VATLRDLKRRIRSIKSTQQITKAMEMVAAAKLRRAQEKLGAARPYAEKLSAVLQMLAKSTAAEEHPFFQKREGDREALLLVTSDRGLCGGYNTNLGRAAGDFLRDKDPDKLQLTVVGRKGVGYLKHRGWPATTPFIGIGDQVDFEMVRKIAHAAVDPFTRGEVDRVTLISTQFISATRRNIVVTPFLPIEDVEGGDEGGGGGNYIFEPSEAEIFDQLVPRYTTAQIYSMLAESFAAEHATRMIAMGNATRNAEEFIDALILKRNRLRQAAITSELADIVGTAEAVT